MSNLAGELMMQWDLPDRCIPPSFYKDQKDRGNDKQHDNNTTGSKECDQFTVATAFNIIFYDLFYFQNLHCE